MIINTNDEIKKLKSLEDDVADKITTFAGSMKFVYLHSVWFCVWILLNIGIFGFGMRFDDFPFGLLTLVVSLEAIFLSTFVMISQNRQASAADIRSELDYQVNVKAEKEIDVVMKTLQRIAKNQRVDTQDLMHELQEVRKLSGVNNP
jgi:uncharacterized membrane protein